LKYIEDKYKVDPEA